MNKNLVIYRPFDAMHVAVKDATHKVSLDGGGTWSTLNANEKKNGFEVQFDIPFIARVEKIGRWPVEALMVVRDYSGDYSGPPKLEKFADRSNFDELGIPEDFGVHSFHSHSAGGGIWSHVLTVSLTLFRDAKYEARNNGSNDPPLNSYKHDILSFAGERVLSEKSKDKSGLERFAALMEKSVVDHDRKSRSLLMAIAPPTGADSFPRLVLFWFPKELNLDQAVPVHVFFTPPTGKKAGEYPYKGDWLTMMDNYLVGGGKRLLCQHSASHRRCIFVFPVTQPKGYFPKIQDARFLRWYLKELVYYVKRTSQKNRFPKPNLGHCAISGFSQAGSVLQNLLHTGAGFPELKEAYAFDIATDAKAFGNEAKSWLDADKSRRLRVYSTQSTKGPWSDLATDLSLKKTGDSIGGAEEYQGAGVTFFWSPLKFWQALYAETGLYFSKTPNTKEKDPDDIHQRAPCLFLEHALVNSDYPKANLY